MELLRRARGILEKEGWWELIKRMWLWLHQSVIDFGRYYVYENDFSNLPSLPPNRHPIFIFQDRDKITIKGYTDGSLAHVSYVCLVEKLQRELDKVPIKVNYLNGECFTGGSRTFPKFRRRGLYTNVYSLMFHYLKHEGYKRCLFTVGRNNIPPQKAQVVLGSRIIGGGTYINILGRKIWKEKRDTGM